ncbi:MAG: 16S rRNA (uracil(1498)-N(3))-methyltransferase [Rickettsiaceae bacterium]|nr:16S rRNA (uracil(1498)-N(3))-methyltransferase [Rickettsiaceae bacterium]
MKYSNLSRVYFNSLTSQDQTLIITKSNDNNIFHYLKNVLRLGIGDNFRIFNSNNGEFLAEIIIVKKNELTIKVISLLRQEVLDTPLILALCIIKSEKMLEAIKAAVQLGVTEIVPIIAERSQYKQVNQQRFQRAIIEAVEQSERLLLPKIVTPISLNDFCNRKDIEQIIFANEIENNNNSLSKIKKFANNIAVLVGAEGGFTDIERTYLLKLDKVNSISLGKYVLRTEIATIAILANVTMLRQK